MKNGDNLITLFFFLYRYIPLQKYTVPKNDKLRYRPGLTERPQCPLGHEGQRSCDDTSAPSPVQSVSARTRRGQCVCVCLCVFVIFFTIVCPRWPTESGSGRSQRRKRRCVCVSVCVSVCVCVCSRLAESHRAWYGIFYMVRLASQCLAFWHSNRRSLLAEVMSIQETTSSAFIFSQTSSSSFSFSPVTR